MSRTVEQPISYRRFWQIFLFVGTFHHLYFTGTLMAFLSLLPVGIAQAIAAVNHGLWYARSAEFLRQPWMQDLKWLRATGKSRQTQ